MITTKTSTRLGALLATAVLALTGCAGDPAPAGQQQVPAAESIQVTDAWVKAAESGMSAAFGVLTNDGATDLTVVSAQTEAAAMLELHETVPGDAGETVMRQVEGGFIIPAEGELVLEPGGAHLMLMDLTGPLQAGAEITVTLIFSDRSTLTFAAPVKDYAGANESYDGAESEMDHG